MQTIPSLCFLFCLLLTLMDCTAQDERPSGQSADGVLPRPVLRREWMLSKLAHVRMGRANWFF